MNTFTRKTNVALLAGLLAVGSAFAQDKTASSDPKPPPPQRGHDVLTKFDLDFKGGHPKDLIATIQKATGKTLNALIPDDAANINLPELKMRNIDVVQLFGALREASEHVELHNTGNDNYRQIRSGYGFRQGPGALNDDTIWSFYMDKPIAPPPYKICRFYALGPYLDWGISIDDITTAVKTGAKMLGENSEPTMSFHKDTRLLIVVGEPAKLEIIDSVLTALRPPDNASVWRNPPKSTEKSGGEEKR